MLVSRECFLKREEERGKMEQVVRGNVFDTFFRVQKSGDRWNMDLTADHVGHYLLN